MAPRPAPPVLLKLAAVVVRTERGALRPLWRGAYELLARGLGLALTAGLGTASVYVARTVAARDAVYGLSDVDLVVVSPRAEAVRRRRERLRSALPIVGRALPDLAVYSPAELAEASAASTLAHTGRALYLGPALVPDELGLRERPGVGGPASDWRLVLGTEVRGERPAAGPETTAAATWLELQFWWGQAMRAAARPDDRASAHLVFKLVAEPVRLLLALEHSRVVRDREAALRLALRLLPAEEVALRRALDLRRRLSQGPRPPWSTALPDFVRLSQRVERAVAAAAGETGCEVRLQGTDRVMLDWRGLVLPGAVEDRFLDSDLDPRSRGDLGAAVRSSRPWAYPALRAQGLLAVAAGEPWTRSFLRGVHCEVTAPVVFALADGRRRARFPGIPGLRVGDVAARAVAEHAAWLEQGETTLTGRGWLDGRDAGLPATARESGRLVAAARAGLFHESLHSGEPMLAVGREDVLELLAERTPRCAGAAQECARVAEPGAAALTELRSAVSGLDAYARQARATPVG